MRPNSRFATLLLCVLGAAQQLCPLAVVGARIEQERSQSTMSSTIERHAGSSIQKIEPRKQQKEEGAGSDGASGRAGEAVGAAAESEPDADEQEKPQKKKKTRRYVAADGTVFAFNSTTRNWELETGTVAGGGSAPMLLIKDRVRLQFTLLQRRFNMQCWLQSIWLDSRVRHCAYFPLRFARHFPTTLHGANSVLRDILS